MKILRKDFPEEYVSDVDLDKDISGKSYLIVTTLITNSGGERDRIGDEGSLILRLASS